MSVSRPHTQPHAAVVYHPLKTDVELLRGLVQRMEDEYGWAHSQWIETNADDAGVSATEFALRAGCNVVLASGGDGTIRAVASALRDTKVPLTVIPQGTGNLLARNLGMQLGDIETAVRAAFAGINRPIDLGLMHITREDETVEEHAFLVLAGMGLDARAVSATRAQLKKRLGWLAYVDAGLRTIFRDAPLQIHYSIDDAPAKPLSVYTVMIGNCGLMPGGVLLIPDALLDDGRLDVVALRPLGPFSWLSIWQKIGWENGVLRKSKTGRQFIDLVNDTKSVMYATAKLFTVSVPHPEPIQLDGDDFGLAIAAQARVDPGSLIVRVMPGWEDPVASLAQEGRRPKTAK